MMKLINVNHVILHVFIVMDHYPKIVLHVETEVQLEMEFALKIAQPNGIRKTEFANNVMHLVKNVLNMEILNVKIVQMDIIKVEINVLQDVDILNMEIYQQEHVMIVIQDVWLVLDQDH